MSPTRKRCWSSSAPTLLFAVLALAGCPSQVDLTAFPRNLGAVDPARSLVAVDRASGVVADGVDHVTVTITVRDASGKGLAGLLLSVAATGSGNTIGQPTGQTDAQGVARATLASTVAEVKTITATVESSQGRVVLQARPTVEFRDGRPSTPAKLAFVAGPQAVMAGATLPPVTVAIQDAAGSTVTSATNAVTLGLAPGAAGATLLGATTVNAAAGVATFSDLRIEKAGAGYQLVATSVGLASATSAAFDVSPDAPFALSVLTGPSDAIAGQAISPPVRIEVLDAFGNRATNAALTVSLEIAAGPSGGTLLGTHEATTQAGIASFPDLRIEKAGPGYVLAASAPSVAGALTAAFEVFWADLSRFLVAGIPASLVAGATSSVSVTALDTFGNTILGYTGSVRFRSSDPQAELPMQYAFHLGDAGTHLFAGVRLKTKGPQTVTAEDASNPTLSGNQTVSVAAAEPAALAFRPGPQDTVAGELFDPPVVVAIVDAFGNETTSTATVDLALTSDSPAATLLGMTSVPALAGLALFADLHMTKATTGTARYKLQASAMGFAPVPSAPFRILPALIDHFAVSGLPSQMVAGTTVASLTVTAQDEFDNTAVGYGGTVKLSAPTDPQAEFPGLVNAQYTFQGSDMGVAVLANAVRLKTAATLHLVVVEDVLEPSVSGSQGVRVDPADPFKLLFAAPLPGAFVRDAIQPAIEVRVTDEFGNLRSERTDQIQVALQNSMGATLAGTLQQTASQGKATFGDLSVDKEGSYTLSATSVGAPSLQAAMAALSVVDNKPPGKAVLTSDSIFNTIGSIRIDWDAPGDDGAMGDIPSTGAYELYYSKTPFAEGALGDATKIILANPPQLAGLPESYTVTGLEADTTYHFRLLTRDGAGNSSVSDLHSSFTCPCSVGYTGPTCSECAPGYKRDQNNLCDTVCNVDQPCATAPADRCEGNTRISSTAPGTCTPTGQTPFYTCMFTETQTDCTTQVANGICFMGQCISDPCVGNPCVTPAAKCEADGVTLTTFAPSTCAPSLTGPVCTDHPSSQSCAATGKICFMASCQTASSPVMGDVIITEVLHNPSGADEAAKAPKRWFELRNVASPAKLLDLRGLTIEGASASPFAVPMAVPLPLAQGGYFVFGASTDPGVNGGATVHLAIVGFVLAGSGNIQIKNGAALVDELPYDGSFPQTEGMSMNLAAQLASVGPRSNVVGHRKPWYWCAAAPSSAGNNATCGFDAAGVAVNYCAIRDPLFPVTVDAGSTDQTVYGRFWDDPANGASITEGNHDGNDFYEFFFAELGHGVGTDPQSWTSWVPAPFNAGYVSGSGTFEPNNDELQAILSIPTVGDYRWGFRFRLWDPAAQGGAGGFTAYQYCDELNIVGDPLTNGQWGDAAALPVISGSSHPIAPRGSRLVLTLAGTTASTPVEGVTIGGVVQSFTATGNNAAVTVTVGGATPTGTQPVVVTVAGKASDPVNVEVIDALVFDYPVLAHGASLTITGIGNATSVSVGGVAHAPTATTATTVSIGPLSDAVGIGMQDLSVTTAGGATAPVPITVIHLVLSEVDSDQPGATDMMELVEISAGVPNVSLSGYMLVFFQGFLNGDRSYLAVSLNAMTDADGFVLAGSTAVAPDVVLADNVVQNGEDGVAIYQASSFPNGTQATQAGLIDALVYHTNDTGVAQKLLDTLMVAGSSQQNECGPGQTGGASGDCAPGSYTNFSLQRCGAARRSSAVWVLAEPTPGLANACP